MSESSQTDSGSFSGPLRQARERRDLTIDEVHQATGISVTVLHALEAGDLSQIESVFLRLGLRSYAEYLDLDGDELVSAYDVVVPSAAKPAVAPSATSAPVAAAAPWLANIPKKWQLLGLAGGGLILLLIIFSLLSDDAAVPTAQPKPKSLPAGQATPSAAGKAAPTTALRPRVTADPNLEKAPAVAPKQDRPMVENGPSARGESTAAAMAAAPAPLAIDSPSTAAPSQAEPAQAPAVPANDETRTGVAATTVFEARSAPPPIAAPDSLLTLRIEAIDEVWVQIEADRRAIYEKTVVPGFVSPTWQAREYFRVTSGKPHGLRYWFQNGLLGEEGRLGDANQVLRFRATRDGVEFLRPDPPTPETAATTDTLQ